MTDRGAYGLRLPGLDVPGLVDDVPQSWPEWRLQFEAPDDVTPDLTIGDDHAVIPHVPGGCSHINRLEQTTRVVGAQMDRNAIVHPILGATALMVAEWSGKVVLHGGAFVDATGRAWGVLGSRGAGKSSFMAWCLTNGFPVITDDLIVTDGEDILTGPRCLDLRRSAATYFGIGTNIGVIGSRRRWRVETGPLGPSAPLAGWIVPEWGASVDIVKVPIAERTSYINDNRALLIRQQHPIVWMKMIAKPLFRLVRPQSWDAVDLAMGDAMRAVHEGGDESTHTPTKAQV